MTLETELRKAFEERDAAAGAIDVEAGLADVHASAGRTRVAVVGAACALALLVGVAGALVFSDDGGSQVDLADNDAPGSTIADDTADNVTGSSVPGHKGSTPPTIDDDPVPTTD
ncbi:MAG: hypothetical protein ACR2P0_12815, partial [Acidimicrobiales bacterium]